MLFYFGPNSWQRKENYPKQNKVSPPHICRFLGLPLPHFVPAVPMLLCPPVGSISLFHNTFHAFITTPYIQAVPSAIQSIQMLEWALPTCFQAVAMLVHLALRAAAILALCLLMSVLNAL